MSGADDIDRRRMLSLARSLGAVAFAPAGVAAQTGGPAGKAAKAPATENAAGTKRFLTPTEHSLLDELAESLIPADDVSGGAKAARVADAIDLNLGESIDPELRQSWRDDLAEIDRISVAMSGKPFVKASPMERERVLRRISRNEAAPKEPGEHAFVTIKWEVALTYYKTRVGIHDDLKYQGNVLLDEFVGTDVSKA